MNSRFFVHIVDQQLQHYVPAASQTAQSLHLIPKLQNPGMHILGHARGVEAAYIACSVVGAHAPAAGQVWVVGSAEMESCMPVHGLDRTVYVAAAVVGLVLERMRNADNLEVSLVLAVGLGYMQDE